MKNAIRSHILKILEQYHRLWVLPDHHWIGFSRKDEESRYQRIQKFVLEHEDFFCRHQYSGHITGSALITDTYGEKVVLTYHGKLNKWLQLGGHGEAESCPKEIAFREGMEESGIDTIKLWPIWKNQDGTPGPLPIPFDIDVHEIPRRANEPSHWHFDFRYLFLGDGEQPLMKSEESVHLRWVYLADAEKLTDEVSMVRQFEKLRYLNRIGGCLGAV